MRKSVVKGMSCAACSARVEKAVSKVNGVATVKKTLEAMDGAVRRLSAIKAVRQLLRCQKKRM